MENIGSLLREKRELKKLSVKDVSANSRIAVKYVGSLEEDDVSGFPAEVYYIGFLRRYAKYLGLDDEALVEAYKREKTSKENAVCEQPYCQPSRSTVKIILLSVLLLALIGTIIYTWLSCKIAAQPEPVQEKIQPVPSAVEIKEEVKQVPLKAASPKAVIQKAEPAPKPVVPTAALKKLSLEIETIAPVWVKVTSDGVVKFEGILEKGINKTWSADEKFGFVTGYAPGVVVRFNGKTIDMTQGAKQDVNSVTLTADSEKKPL